MTTKTPLAKVPGMTPDLADPTYHFPQAKALLRGRLKPIPKYDAMITTLRLEPQELTLPTYKPEARETSLPERINNIRQHTEAQNIGNLIPLSIPLKIHDIPSIIFTKDPTEDMDPQSAVTHWVSILAAYEPFSPPKTTEHSTITAHQDFIQRILIHGHEKKNTLWYHPLFGRRDNSLRGIIYATLALAGSKDYKDMFYTMISLYAYQYWCLIRQRFLQVSVKEPTFSVAHPDYLTLIFMKRDWATTTREPMPTTQILQPGQVRTEVQLEAWAHACNFNNFIFYILSDVQAITDQVYGKDLRLVATNEIEVWCDKKMMLNTLQFLTTTRYKEMKLTDFESKVQTILNQITGVVKDSKDPDLVYMKCTKHYPQRGKKMNTLDITDTIPPAFAVFGPRIPQFFAHNFFTPSVALTTMSEEDYTRLTNTYYPYQTKLSVNTSSGSIDTSLKLPEDKDNSIYNILTNLSQIWHQVACFYPVTTADSHIIPYMKRIGLQAGILTSFTGGVAAQQALGHKLHTQATRKQRKRSKLFEEDSAEEGEEEEAPVIKMEIEVEEEEEEEKHPTTPTTTQRPKRKRPTTTKVISTGSFNSPLEHLRTLSADRARYCTYTLKNGEKQLFLYVPELGGLHEHTSDEAAIQSIGVHSWSWAAKTGARFITLKAFERFFIFDPTHIQRNDQWSSLQPAADDMQHTFPAEGWKYSTSKFKAFARIDQHSVLLLIQTLDNLEKKVTPALPITLTLLDLWQALVVVLATEEDVIATICTLGQALVKDCTHPDKVRSCLITLSKAQHAKLTKEVQRLTSPDCPIGAMIEQCHKQWDHCTTPLPTAEQFRISLNRELIHMIILQQTDVTYTIEHPHDQITNPVDHFRRKTAYLEDFVTYWTTRAPVDWEYLKALRVQRYTIGSDGQRYESFGATGMSGLEFLIHGFAVIDAQCVFPMMRVWRHTFPQSCILFHDNKRWVEHLTMGDPTPTLTTLGEHLLASTFTDKFKADIAFLVKEKQLVTTARIPIAPLNYATLSSLLHLVKHAPGFETTIQAITDILKADGESATDLQLTAQALISKWVVTLRAQMEYFEGLQATDVDRCLREAVQHALTTQQRQVSTTAHPAQLVVDIFLACIKQNPTTRPKILAYLATLSRPTTPLSPLYTQFLALTQLEVSLRKSTTAVSSVLFSST